MGAYLPWIIQYPNSANYKCRLIIFVGADCRGLNKNDAFMGFKIRCYIIFLYNSFRKSLFRGYWKSWIGPRKLVSRENKAKCRHSCLDYYSKSAERKNRTLYINIVVTLASNVSGTSVALQQISAHRELYYRAELLGSWFLRVGTKTEILHLFHSYSLHKRQ